MSIEEMITKYVTRWGAIHTVDIVRETDKCVFTLWLDGSERKSNKRTGFENYFDEFEDAKNFLIKGAEALVASHRARLESANGDLGRIKGIKIEDVKELK